MRSFRPESAFNCENPEVWVLKLTAIARASTADGFGYQSVGKMTEAGLLSGVVAQHSRLAADAEKRVVGMLHPIAAGSPRRGGRSFGS